MILQVHTNHLVADLVCFMHCQSSSFMYQHLHFIYILVQLAHLISFLIAFHSFILEYLQVWLSLQPFFEVFFISSSLDSYFIFTHTCISTQEIHSIVMFERAHQTYHPILTHQQGLLWVPLLSCRGGWKIEFVSYLGLQDPSMHQLVFVPFILMNL